MIPEVLKKHTNFIFKVQEVLGVLRSLDLEDEGSTVPFNTRNQ